MPESVKASEDPKVAADVIAEEAYQRMKLTAGTDGTATDVSAAAPLPVADAAALVALEAITTALGLTIKVGDGSGALTVDGTVGVSSLPELPAGTKAIGKLAANSGVDIGDVDVTSLPELPTGSKTIGKVEVAGEGKVKVSALEGEPKVKVAELPSLPAGTNSIGQTDPRGNKAHDEVDAGNPIKTGGRARTALPAAVAQDDRSDAIFDKFGRQLGTVIPLDQRTSGTTNFTNETAADVIAAPGASTALVITGIKVVNNHATVKTKVEILNDATKIDLGAAAPNGGGWIVSDPNGLFPPLTTNKALRAKCLTTGADVDVTAYGYKIPA